MLRPRGEIGTVRINMQGGYKHFRDGHNTSHRVALGSVERRPYLSISRVAIYWELRCFVLRGEVGVGILLHKCSRHLQSGRWSR